MRSTIVVATYNIHGAVGIDRRYTPERIARVIGELDADIVALQEIQSKSDFDMLEFLARENGYRAIAGPTMKVGDGGFGNGLLTRFPVTRADSITLDFEKREPRAAIDATIDIEGFALRVIATHLGLSPHERRTQVQALLAAVRTQPSTPTILLGDLNEWFLRARALQYLHAHFGEPTSRATYPSLFPMLALDRIWCSPAEMLQEMRAHRSATACRASDHLPLVAKLGLDTA
jgi:endonuclease/exonuclease/phosphatase family metal-dependent hydrolase